MCQVQVPLCDLGPQRCHKSRPPRGVRCRQWIHWPRQGWHHLLPQGTAGPQHSPWGFLAPTLLSRHLAQKKDASGRDKSGKVARGAGTLPGFPVGLITRNVPVSSTGLPLFSRQKPADSPAQKKTRAGVTVAGGNCWSGWSYLGAVSFIICQGQKQLSRVPESQWARAARAIHPGTAVRSPDPQSAAVVSQQQAKEPPPQKQSPRSPPSESLGENQSGCLSA